ncbi:MAG: glycoside hydrolase family 31 protein, partial [Bacteroidaceae bacterium]|nr:glycoside hydrolase family 31 protein [Bacteroidaceae bacterium]
DKVKLTHETDYMDYFVMVNETPVQLLNDYYQLTGNPVLLPKFGFYEGHLNAYNRDYWKEEDGSGYGVVKFEDGKYYKESQKDNGGIRESLNGELEGNYQFSARAVIDRYKNNDMPLGWLLPNDGYGAGYGQTSTLDGNVANLKAFGDYARKNGVEIGLWTQSDLHPIDSISALLQRDIVKEIRDAGVRVLKTDVAWVGAGYSFGLNGISDVANLMPQYGNNARPFIITLDGWAGTQRYGGVWSGDQTGGKWEYIRFHIPTYIGSGLAGQPNISSDMDGIFGGKNVPVNVRDFQWKTFTPMQLNMDGWGSNQKYPHALGEPAASINRVYLKMKSMFMPYTYSIAKEAVDGKPMVRAIFLEDPNKYTLGKATQYEFLYGSSVLVAPIYQETTADEEGNDVRHNIYLPEGEWIDYFTGNTYVGGGVLNSFDAPLWKLPIFVRSGSIIPMTNANNNVSEIDKKLRIYEIYPKWNGSVSFTEYDDDGVTQAYLKGEGATTEISAKADGNQTTVDIKPTVGSFTGQETVKATQLRVCGNFVSVDKVVATVGGKKVKLKAVKSLAEFESSTKPVYFVGNGVDYTKFLTTEIKDGDKSLAICAAEGVSIKLPATDVTKNAVSVTLTAQRGETKTVSPHSNKPTEVSLSAPAEIKVDEADRKPYSLKLNWGKVAGAEAYEIEFDGMNYFDIRENGFLFEDLVPETNYSFKVRSTAKGKVSEWKNFSAMTNKDPFEFAVKGMTATCTAPSQGGERLNKLFDFDEETGWHTAYGEKAVPFELVIDMHSVNTLDKMVYQPRKSGVNGIILEGSVAVSMDKETWMEVGPIEWKRDAEAKEIVFSGNPQARYVKINVTKAYGDFGSGNQIYVFRVEGTPFYVPGDVNNDGVLDNNDLTSYMNYTGLRSGDGDFEGYVSRGDINGNGLIDAYDISNAAVEVGGLNKSQQPQTEKLAGTIVVSTDKSTYKAGEEVVVAIKGVGLDNVNAFSLCLPYSDKQLQYVGNEAVEAKAMENFSRDRLHTSGQKAFYPTFVGVDAAAKLKGDVTLATVRFKAKTSGALKLKATDIILVDSGLYSIKVEDTDKTAK